jgi:type II secretory pathway pseudopilin PulG
MARKTLGQRAAARVAAFTLVELVTAVSIMTIIMIGVVEIFAVVTQTAAEAEAIHGAYQQMRATFDRLNRDLRGITPEGYIRIDANETTGASGETASYATNSLTFVSVGRHFGIYNDPQEPPCRAGAAEILYTTNVATPTSFLTIDETSVDHRRGVLARSAWLMDGQAGQAQEDEDESKAPYLGNLCASLGGASPLPVGRAFTRVVPFLPGDPGTPDASVRRVMTTGTSEFFVEYLDGSGWQKPDPGTTKTFNAGDSGWPRAIRVTLAVHDPDDRGPLPSGQTRFQGYALQEVFWIGSR